MNVNNVIKKSFLPVDTPAPLCAYLHAVLRPHGCRAICASGQPRKGSGHVRSGRVNAQLHQAVSWVTDKQQKVMEKNIYLTYNCHHGASLEVFVLTDPAVAQTGLGEDQIGLGGVIVDLAPQVQNRDPES